MNFLGILTNKYFLIGVLVVSLYGYHYFKVSGLESEILVLQTNNTTLKENLDKAIKTNESNRTELEQIVKNKEDNKVQEKILVNSYIKEIEELKLTINSLSYKPKIKEKIVIKDCEIKILKGDKNEDKIYKVITNIGNIGNFKPNN